MNQAYCIIVLSIVASVLAQQESCTCRPKVRCAWAVARKSQTSNFVCDLGGGKKGYCCPDILAKPFVLTRKSSRAPPLLSVRASVASPVTSSTIPPPITSTSPPIIPRRATEVEDYDTNEVESPTPPEIIPGRTSGEGDYETRGHRLFTKPKREFQDLRDYAKKILHLG